MEGLQSASRAQKRGSGVLAIYVKDTERGVRVRTTSAFLERFCDGWVDRMAEYEKVVGASDWPFWYGERSLVGFLAAGIWASGGVCIEEFRAYKKPDVATRPRETFLGRGDLYFQRAEHAGNVEFKLHEIGITENDHFTNFLTTKWRKTQLDANRSRQYGIPRFGGMFLSPYIGSQRDVPRYEDNLKRLLTLSWDTLRPDALAWWCPINQVLEGERNTKNWIVGAILPIKRVKR
jgi:hypothetical protein